jgi:uncharacterized protein (TIGR02231 family)
MILASRVSVFALLLLTSFPLPALADTLTAESKVAAATVYADRATVTREAVIDLPAGAHTVSFTGLPSFLFPESLRAEGTATGAAVTFGAIVSKKVMGTRLSADRAAELAAKIDTLGDERRLLESEKQSLSAKKQFLTTLTTQAGLRAGEDIAEFNLKPDQWIGAAQAIYSGLQSSLTAEVAIDTKIRDMDRELDKLKSDLNQLSGTQYETFEIAIPLESSQSTRLTISLNYQVPNASWRPLYDARIDTESGKLDLIQYGAVSQSTGEDWSGIKLSLSTAQPQRGTSLPDLPPFWLDLFKDGYGGGAVGNMMDKLARREVAAAPAMMAMEEKVVASDSSLAAPASRPAQFAGAKIETGGFVSEYKITGPASVKADGTETKLMVGPFSTESQIKIHIKPQISTDAFLVAETKLKGENPILSGQVSLFRDGAYVGESSLPLLRPEESHALFFGTDDQVSVKRKVLEDKKSEGGMIVRDNTLERYFVTEIQNLHSKKMDIVVEETTPTGRNEKIQTEILADQTTSGFVADSENIKGLLRWDFPLDPKAKKDLKLGWKVTWPKDENLSGL